MSDLHEVFSENNLFCRSIAVISWTKIRYCGKFGHFETLQYINMHCFAHCIVVVMTEALAPVAAGNLNHDQTSKTWKQVPIIAEIFRKLLLIKYAIE